MWVGSPNQPSSIANRAKTEYIPGVSHSSAAPIGGFMLRSLPVRAALVPVLILTLGASPALMSAQQASPTEVPSITIRANTRLVTVDVVVTNKKGQPIPGLKADDFTLEENGKKQKISILVPPGLANATAPSPAPPGILSNHPEHVAPSTGVPTVLLLDAMNSGFSDQAYARSQMLKYVLEQSQSGHTMAVFVLLDRVRVLQQFTSDPQALFTAIKNFKPGEPILQPAAAPAESHGVTTGPDRGGSGGGAMGSVQLAVREFADMQIGYSVQRGTLGTIEAMKALTRILGGLPGRKNVVWLTASLPFDLIPEDRPMKEAELQAELPGQGRQRSVSVNAAGSYESEARQLYGQEIKDAEARLASANIAIYPVDLTGLMSGLERSATRQPSVSSETGVADRVISTLSAQQISQGTMEEVAAETGGKAYINQNEIRYGVTLAVADEAGTYLLGYYPENKKWDGKYRSLKVKINQGDARVRARKGYYAIDAGQVKGANYESDVASALQISAPATQVSFMAQAKPTDPGKMRVVFLVDAHTLSAEDSGGKKKMSVAMYAGIYDGNGKSLGMRSTKVDQAFDDATYQQILAKGMMVPIDMEMPTGATELRAAVLDNKTGFIGTANGPLGP
jgi:VWFA-related protein